MARDATTQLRSPDVSCSLVPNLVFEDDASEVKFRLSSIRAELHILDQASSPEFSLLRNVVQLLKHVN